MENQEKKKKQVTVVHEHAQRSSVRCFKNLKGRWVMLHAASLSRCVCVSVRERDLS